MNNTTEQRPDAITWHEYKAKNTGHFFDEDTMLFFDSKVHGTPQRHGDFYYGVVSTRYDLKGARRFYSVVRMSTDGGRVERAHRADRNDETQPEHPLRFTDKDRAIQYTHSFTVERDVKKYRWY